MVPGAERKAKCRLKVCSDNKIPAKKEKNIRRKGRQGNSNVFKKPSINQMAGREKKIGGEYKEGKCSASDPWRSL